MVQAPTGTVPSVGWSQFGSRFSLTTTPEWHLARRAAHGPTAALAEQIRQMGAQAWIDRQLQPETIPDPAWDAFAGWRLPWLTYDYPTLLQHAGADNRIGGALVQALVHRPVFTERVLWESVVTFWGDHIYIPWRSKAAGHVVGFDRDVLRPFALGRYADLLYAAVTSPALLVFLDNIDNMAGHRNENLGREILEIYTVGRRYTEDDVRASSVILTGLGVDKTSGQFRFRGSDHISGPVSVLGFSHANPPVSGEGTTAPAVVRAYTDYLAHHPATAERIARKLLARFVSDVPSEDMVRQIAQVYLDNDTATVPVLKAIFAHPEFWGSVGHKWARPREVITATRRACRQTSYDPPLSLEQDAWAMGPTGWTYQTAGDLPRDWPMVDGYPDDAASWNGSSTMLATWNAVAGVALHWDSGAPDPHWDQVLGVDVGDKAWDVAQRITLQLTGYTWPYSHVGQVASMLSHLGTQPAAQSDVLNSDHLRWNLPEAVHLVMSSPYAFAR